MPPAPLQARLGRQRETTNSPHKGKRFVMQDIRPVHHAASFAIPYNFKVRNDFTKEENVLVAAIVPSFKPGILTVRLVEDLLRWNESLEIYVVDDCTPNLYEETFGFFTRIKGLSDRVTVLRTPINKMKAGAINYALAHIGKRGVQPEIIITLDDDVMIDKYTVQKLVEGVMADPHIGAACSQCRVLNKNVNILTRLQGLEYLGFNAVRLADEGFFFGPLVMHGMLTAFRLQALTDVGGFAENHLIEDYEVTARLKGAGWHVRLAPNAYAWTEVPETFSQLWKQRTRWIYGGLTILARVKFLPALIQDIIGHAMFLATLTLVIISVLFASAGRLSPEFLKTIVFLSIAQVVILYVFQLWLMRFYAEKDRTDWALRILLIPEFLYANVLSLVLVGAYIFGFFNFLTQTIPELSIVRSLRAAFFKLGYTNAWGTRTTS
ncbi:glycosyltransferase family 2 protein [Acetobacteraceae bacterium]|nr:glycosyltransferase family 2 protein [Candidatus Parcubacteria bacterium]